MLKRNDCFLKKLLEVIGFYYDNLAKNSMKIAYFELQTIMF